MIPPFMMAGPISVRLAYARSWLVPAKEFQITPIDDNNRHIKLNSTFGDEESVSDVRGVVDAQSDDEDDADADDGVDGEAPEVDEADDVDEGEDDAGQHEDDQLHGGEHEHRDDEHGHHREAQVPPQLAAHHVVALPRRVDLQDWLGRIN